MTAVQLKNALRDYAEQEFGGRWEAASAMVLIPGGTAESLVVFRDDGELIRAADDQPPEPSA